MEIYCKSCDKVLGHYPDEKIPPGVKGYTNCKLCGEKITIYREPGKSSPAPLRELPGEKASKTEDQESLPHLSEKKDWGVKKADVLAVLLLILTSVATIVLAKPDFDLSKRFPKDLTFEPTGEVSEEGIYLIEKSAREIKRHDKPVKSISINEMVAIRQYLTEEKYEELNKKLDGYQKEFEEDPLKEFKINDAYRVFDTDDKSLEKALIQWRDAYPHNYQPYLALARYYSVMGWTNRWKTDGGKSSTEPIQIMNKYFIKAEKNAKIALGIKKNLLPAYLVLIGISNSSSIGGNENDFIEDGLKLFPYSYLLRGYAMWAKEPRWGGSFRAMERIAREAEKYSQSNPILISLYGDIYIYQGRDFRKMGNDKKAFELFQMALAYGEDSGIYSEIADLYCENREYGLALKNIDRSIELRPTEDHYYRIRAKINMDSNNLAESIEDINKAIQIKPGYSKNKELMDKILLKRKKTT